MTGTQGHFICEVVAEGLVMEAQKQRTGNSEIAGLKTRLGWPAWRTGNIRLYRNMKELLDMWKDQLARDHV